MIKVCTNGDKVILDLCGRKRDVILSPLEAANLAGALCEAATLAEAELPGLIIGDVWSVFVTNFDRHVVMRITPLNDVGNPERVPMPGKAARKIADLLRTNADFAGVGMRITFSRN